MSSSKKVSRYELGYHDSIDTLMIIDYNKVLETGNLKWLIIEGKHSPIKLAKAWEKINDEIIEERLKDEDFKREYEQQVNKGLYRINAIKTRNTAALHRLKIEDKEAEEVKSFNLYDVIKAKQEGLPYQINENTMTVRRFLNL